jgi:hypothetical protein
MVGSFERLKLELYDSRLVVERPRFRDIVEVPPAARRRVVLTLLLDVFAPTAVRVGANLFALAPKPSPEGVTLLSKWSA